MLSQHIPSAACHLAAGIDVESAGQLLHGASIEFEKIVKGLEYGDESLGIIGAESRKKTLFKKHDLREKLAPVKAAARMVSGDASQTQLEVVLGQNMAVLGSARLLVSELVGQYSDPSAMLQADSILIDIAGRQRMLTQKMSKEACMIQSGQETAETAADLDGTMQMFEVSLMALRNGLPEAGIKQPPNQEIVDGLDIVILNWNNVNPTFETIAAGTSVSGDDATSKSQDLNTTMANMNKLLGMYTEAAKLGH